MRAWGLCLGPAWGASVADLLDAARTAEERGFDRIATGEYRSDALTWLALLAGATRRVPVATTIASIALRHPSVAGEALAALRDVHGDRIELGLGVSHPSLVTGDLGLPQPTLADLESYVATVRAVVAGQPAEHGTYRVPAHGRDRAAGGPAKVLVSALGEAAAVRAAAYADGVVLTWSPTGWTRRLAGLVRAADAQTGRRTAVWVVLPALVADDLRVAREACARHLQPYLRLPSYRRMLLEASDDPDRIAHAAGPEVDARRAADVLGAPLLEQLAAMGGPDRLAGAVEAVRVAGADEVILYPLDTGSGWREAVQSTVTRCAPAR